MCSDFREEIVRDPLQGLRRKIGCMLNSTILGELRDAVDRDSKGLQSGLITAANELQTYECDGLTNFRVLPGAVVLPRSTEQVQAVIRICAKHGIPFVARGAGTGLSGGALPAEGGIVISFARMTRILEIDIPNQRVVVEPLPMATSTLPILLRRAFVLWVAMWQRTPGALIA
jgi:hypothetical protein